MKKRYGAKSQLIMCVVVLGLMLSGCASSLSNEMGTEKSREVQETVNDVTESEADTENTLALSEAVKNSHVADENLRRPL